MIHDQKPPLDEALLMHYGIKGMHWGVRKTEPSGRPSSSSSVQQAKPGWSNKKKAAVIFGSVVGVAAIGAGAYYAKKHYGISLNSVNKFAKTEVAKPTKQFAQAMAKEPLGIVHSSRGKHHGYTFPQRGGLTDPESEFMRAGLGQGQSHGHFARYGNRLEKVAATFHDPEGRTDFSGRRIVHDVILPESLAKEVNNIDDVQKLVWPKIKDVYDSFYQYSLTTHDDFSRWEGKP